MVSDFFSKDNTVSLFFALAHTSVSTCPGIVQANHKRLFNMVGFDTTKERRWGILPKQPRWLPLKYAFTVLWQDVWQKDVSLPWFVPVWRWFTELQVWKLFGNRWRNSNVVLSLKEGETVKSLMLVRQLPVLTVSQGKVAFLCSVICTSGGRIGFNQLKSTDLFPSNLRF